MDVEKVRQGVLDWLRQIKYPSGSTGSSWEEQLTVYPSDEGDKKLESGVKIRLALTLRTAQNSYVLTIMECLAPDSREVYILSAYANWKETEKRFQKSLDKGYLGRFEDVLRARHTIWAQTFRESELPEALNSCALALLGNELQAPGPVSDTSSRSGGTINELSHNELSRNELSRNELSDASTGTEAPRSVKRPIVPMTDFPTSDDDPLP